MDRPRLIRGLRIAWSVWWAVLCVLLIVLWVRSNWWVDSLIADSAGAETFNVVSTRSGIGLGFAPDSTAFVKADNWLVESDPIVESVPFFPPAKFSFESSVLGTVVSIPYWFLTFVTAAFTALPWIPLNFSLRTLLIATTLIAVVLGLVVWAST